MRHRDSGSSSGRDAGHARRADGPSPHTAYKSLRNKHTLHKALNNKDTLHKALKNKDTSHKKHSIIRALCIQHYIKGHFAYKAITNKDTLHTKHYIIRTL